MKYVSRSAWGAKAARCSSPLPAIDTLVFHYSAMDADERASHSECAARVRGIQAYHQNTQGWCDVAYNWLVCKHGYVFEGRGFRYSGATGNDNSHTVAVCFLGDDTAGRDDLTDAGRRALVDVTMYVQAKLGKRLAYKGHRDFMGTACPGNEIHGYIRSTRFADLANGAAPKPPEEEDEMTKARVLALEKAAVEFRAGGPGPGKLTEAENTIYYGFLRQFNQGHKEGLTSADTDKRIAEIKAAAVQTTKLLEQALDVIQPVGSI